MDDSRGGSTPGIVASGLDHRIATGLTVLALLTHTTPGVRAIHLSILFNIPTLLIAISVGSIPIPFNKLSQNY